MKVQLKDLPIGSKFVDPETEISFWINDFEDEFALAKAEEGYEYVLIGPYNHSTPRTFYAGDLLRFAEDFEVEEADVDYPVCDVDCQEKCLEHFALTEPARFRKVLESLNIKQS